MEYSPISSDSVNPRVLAPLALLAFVALLLAGCGDEASQEGTGDEASQEDAEPADVGVPGLSRSGDSTFRGDGFQFEIADNWFEKSKGDAASVEDLGVGGSAARKIKVEGSLIDAIQGEYAANLGLISSDAPREDDPILVAEDYLRQVKAAGKLPVGAGGGAFSFPDSKVRRTEIGGKRAGYYEMLAETPEGDLRQRQIFTIDGKTVYALTFSVLPKGLFDEHLPALEQMLDSWIWE